MAQAYVLSRCSFNVGSSPSPKRACLSLKFQATLSPSKPEPSADSSPTKHTYGIPDTSFSQDENVSPNVSFSEAVSWSPLISADVVVENQKVPVLGLPNIGNTCYLNSVLQVLRYTPNFLSFLHTLAVSQDHLSKVSSNYTEIEEADFFLNLHLLYNIMKKQEFFFHKDIRRHNSLSLVEQLQSMLSSLGGISSEFEEGEQHDAHEFMLVLMSKLDVFYARVKENASAYCANNSPAIDVSPREPLKRKKHRRGRKRRYRSILNEASEEVISSLKNLSPSDLGFEGKMRHTVKCLKCETSCERTESFSNVQVSVAGDLASEETVDLLQCLINKTLLSGENKSFCDECGHLTETLLSSDITSLPSILMIHCSGFRQSSFHQTTEKDDRNIIIPLVMRTFENPDVFSSETDGVYYLYAVVLHIGASIEFGHYVSFVKTVHGSSDTLPSRDTWEWKENESCCATKHTLDTRLKTSDKWLFFDDDNVSLVAIDDTSVFPYYEFMTVSACPYVMFYCKM